MLKQQFIEITMWNVAQCHFFNQISFKSYLKEYYFLCLSSFPVSLLYIFDFSSLSSVEKVSKRSFRRMINVSTELCNTTADRLSVIRTMTLRSSDYWVACRIQINMVSYSNFPSIIESMTFANKQTNSGLNLVYPHVNFTNKDVMERNLN